MHIMRTKHIVFVLHVMRIVSHAICKESAQCARVRVDVFWRARVLMNALMDCITHNTKTFRSMMELIYKIIYVGVWNAPILAWSVYLPLSV